MGKVIVVLLLLGALAGGYFFFLSDSAESFSLTPSFMLTAEENQLRNLENQFDATKKRLAQSNRMAAVGGIDTTADIEAARAQARGLEKELKAMELPEGRAAAKAAELLAAIQQFSRELS
jgi:cob(I)alamin adenosyltransferase